MPRARRKPEVKPIPETITNADHPHLEIQIYDATLALDLCEIEVVMDFYAQA
jgi:hypothetical protein